jgi:hypothetical protein
MAFLAAYPALAAATAATTTALAVKQNVDSSKASKKAAQAAEDAAKKAPLMPDEDALKKQARRDAALRFGQLGSGRASTILDTSDKLGA